MPSLSQEIERHVPRLRRYARATIGDRRLGDRLTERALTSFLHEPPSSAGETTLKVGLFRALQDARGEFDESRNTALRPAAGSGGEQLPGSRDAFFLSTMEDFSHAEIATILRQPFSEIAGLLAIARNDLSQMISARVLLIEDELAAAARLSDIVLDMGLSLIGAAATGDEAIALARQEEPDIILSDILLADGSSGVQVVHRILGTYPSTPVIYVTGFPERLLTSWGNEPVFLVSKPYTDQQVRSAISRALFIA